LASYTKTNRSTAASLVPSLEDATLTHGSAFMDAAALHVAPESADV
jgi:hypothetical protein